MAVCYATSADGIHWEKPDLKLVEFEGNTNNNIVLRDMNKNSNYHGTGIFKDDNERNPKRRYKAFMQGLYVCFSKDGLHWSKQKRLVGTKSDGDTHNNAFWAPTLNKYVGITRTHGKKGRQVARIESDDFEIWTRTELALEGINNNLQPYSMPVFYYGGVYLGLVTIHNQKSDRVHTELTWSPDTKEWHRISQGIPLIPCSDKKLDYDYGCVYTCANPVIEQDEIKLYYGASDWLHYGWRSGSMCLATLRPDGFAGYETEEKAAQIITKALSYAGGAITVNADISNGGFLRVKVLSENGKESEKWGRGVRNKSI